MKKIEAVAPPASLPARDNLPLVAQIVSSYVAHNQCHAGEVAALMLSVNRALAALNDPLAAVSNGKLTPPVPIKKSIGDDFIICLEDGKRLTMLKRYLRSQYDMSPEDYRKKWDLPHDYPMVAPAYARLRSAFAKKIGLGRIPGGGSSAKKKMSA